MAHDGEAQRALARAVGAHQGVDLAAADLEVHSLEDRLARHADVQIADRQRFGHASACFMATLGLRLSDDRTPACTSSTCDVARVVRQRQLVVDLRRRPAERSRPPPLRLGCRAIWCPLILSCSRIRPSSSDFGPRRAAGHVHVDRHDQVHALDHVVAVLEIRPAADRAGAHGDHVLRLGHQVVQPAHAAGHLVGDRAGHDHQVGLPRAGPKGPGPEPVQVEPAGPGRHHLDRTTGQAEGHRPEARLPGPVDRLLQASWSARSSSNRPSIQGCVIRVPSRPMLHMRPWPLR